MSDRIRYALGQFGYSANAPLEAGAPADTFKATAAVSKGDVVIWDTSNAGQVKTCATDSSLEEVAGIAIEAADAGDPVLVALPGAVTLTTADATVTAGDPLTISATTDGQVAPLARTAAVTQLKDVVAWIAVAQEGGSDGDSIQVQVV